MTQTAFDSTKKPSLDAAPLAGRLLQRKCGCGTRTIGGSTCGKCSEKQQTLRRKASTTERESQNSFDAPPAVREVLRSPGQPLDSATRAYMEPRFGHDFSRVRVHTDARAAESARAVNALAYTVGHDVAFRQDQYAPSTSEGRKLIAHELAHVVQQASPQTADGDGRSHAADYTAGETNADAVADAALAGRPVGSILRAAPTVQRRAAPYIKKVTVHLAPPQSADLEWEGTPPASATGSDHFTVSTGKGYGDPGDPAGTCTRMCCSDPLTQCAPPWNQPNRVGACCTYHGNNFWTGTPVPEHNGWQWWTPIQPYYSSRGIALHQHHEVTGQPIGHGCVRMDEPNAKRIYDFSNGRRTNVTIDGRAAPVACNADRQCAATGGGGGGGGTTNSGGGAGASLDEGAGDSRMAVNSHEPIPGMEGVMS